MNSAARLVFENRLKDVRDRVAGMRILQLDEDLTTPIPIDPERLHMDDETAALDSVDPDTIAAVLDALEASAPAPADVKADCRWGAIFADAHGTRLLAIYSDRFGAKGLIDDEPVEFAATALVDWLHEYVPLPEPAA